MQIAPLPANEEQRLARLHGLSVLDTLPQKAFDDISSLAQVICSTPVALITLIDRDRQWFKSRIGVDVNETPREVAFCSHAILDPAHVTVVEDMKEDARFQDNPLVTGPTKVRFYAGAPIVTDDGFVLGTVCVVDQQVRQLHPVQLDALSKLSGLVASLLEHEKARLSEAARSAATARQQHEELMAMAVSSLDLQSFVDASGVYRHVNDTYLAYNGCQREEIIGRHVTEHLGQDTYRDMVESRLRRALAGETVTYQREAHFKARGTRYMEVSLLPVRDDQGRVTGVVTRGHDIQALKEREDELSNTVKLLERKSLEQERFIHLMSHDLREPINAINNFSSLLGSDHGQALPPVARRYLGFVQAGGKRMGTLLDDLLKYVRLDQHALAREPVNLADLVQQVRDDLAPALSLGQGRIEHEPPLPTVQADAPLLRMALQNLITNGLKFARPQLPPQVRVSAVRQDGFDLIQVDDNGIGIAAEHQAGVFDMFKRLHLRKQHEGSGLGLSICQRIAALHGGHLSVRSVPGVGSRFTLHLPVAQDTPS
jgi:PAS domain S-box-containing protein